MKNKNVILNNVLSKYTCNIHLFFGDHGIFIGNLQHTSELRSFVKPFEIITYSALPMNSPYERNLHSRMSSIHLSKVLNTLKQLSSVCVCVLQIFSPHNTQTVLCCHTFLSWKVIRKNRSGMAQFHPFMIYPNVLWRYPGYLYPSFE